MMKVIDTKIETNATIHRGLDGRGGKPLPVEYDTGGAITILEFLSTIATQVMGDLLAEGLLQLHLSQATQDSRTTSLGKL